MAKFAIRKNCVWAALIMALSVAVGWGGPTNRFVALDSPAPAVPYDTWDTAAHDIKSAVDVANAYNAGDTVRVSNGVYNLSAEIIVSNTWVMSVTNDPALTVVDGQGSNRCFSLKHANARVAGLTVTNGYATSGGGVSISNGLLSNCWITACANSSGVAGTGGGGVYGAGTGTIVNCVIAGNQCTNTASGRGGGIYLYQAGMRIENCLVSNNISYQGGGIYIESSTAGMTNVIRYTMVVTNTAANYGGGVMMAGANSVIEHCPITDNIATGEGGGVYKYSGTLQDCIIAGNRAGSGGGGISHNATSGQTVQRCSIVSNVATGGGGGGVKFANGTTGECVVANCLIAWNRSLGMGATDYGGGVFMNGATASVLRNCTVASNLADSASGGLRVAGGHVENSIVYYNIRTNGAIANHSIYSATYVCTFTNSCTTPAITISGNTYGTNNITSDPSFVNKGQGDFRLATGSLCINAGVNRTWMNGARDLDGVSRIDRFNGIVDIGAYEYILRGTMFTGR